MDGGGRSDLQPPIVSDYPPTWPTLAPPLTPEQVEHQVDHVADDTAQMDAEAKFEWRAKARRRRKGRFVPPNMKTYRWPVFVRVADLQKRDRG